MEVSRGSRLPLPLAHCRDRRPAPNSQRGGGGGLAGSPWWPDRALASTLGSPALILPPRQAGAQTLPCSTAHPTAPAPLSFESLLTFDPVAVKDLAGDFPAGPLVKTPRSQYRGPRLDPWSGKKIPHAATKSPHAATKSPHGAAKSPYAAAKSPHATTKSPHAATKSPHAAAKSLHAATTTWCSQINKY